MEIIEYIKQKPDVIRFVLRRLCLVEMNLLEIKNECGEPSQETKKDAWGLLLFFFIFFDFIHFFGFQLCPWINIHLFKEKEKIYEWISPIPLGKGGNSNSPGCAFSASTVCHGSLCKLHLKTSKVFLHHENTESKHVLNIRNHWCIRGRTCRSSRDKGQTSHIAITVDKTVIKQN